jgi:hypothetical protein
MDNITLEKMAVTAFEKLAMSRTSLFGATEGAIEAKAELENAKYQALVGGVIDGKNAEIREAQLRTHLEANYAKLETAERTERAARHQYDQASVEVDTVKTLLRIAELK